MSISFIELISLLGAGSVLLAMFLAEGWVLWMAVSGWRGAKHTRLVWGLHGFAFLIGAAAGWAYFVEPNWIEVNTIQIQTDKITKPGLRIVHFSDTHCDVKKRNEDKLVRIINSLEPDVVVFTGDSLNDTRAIGNFKEMLSKIKAKLGKFAVKGNFESSLWSEMDLFGSTGFELLDGRAVRVTGEDGQVLNVLGVDCMRSSSIYSVRQKLLAGDSNEFTVLLDHWPDDIEMFAGQVDLYLAGHTHGGQVAMPFYGAIITFSKFGKKYEAGRYDVNGTTLYVNRGIGMEGAKAPRIRFMARPEITVFDVSR